MNVLLGVSSSISVYKSVEILRLFQKNGHSVSVVMTESARQMIMPITFETFAPGKVYWQLFKEGQDPLIHINLAKDNEMFLIAPATANIIGKCANGIADDLITTTFLAFNGRVVMAPAMNTHMWENPAVVENIERLRSRGVEVLEPDTGELACRDESKGRLLSPDKIYQYCIAKKDV